VVLCHGVLMYFADPGPLLDAIAQVVAPDGTVSLLVRNGDALAQRRLAVSQWYGVRIFTDMVASDTGLPDEATLEALLNAEERAGRTDPYRHVAALLHVIAERDGAS
jgi:SAM-dependent methyltransferase